MKKFYLLPCLLLSFYLLKAQVGNLDPTFGVSGIEKFKFIRKGTITSSKGESYGIQIINDYSNPSIRVYKYLSNGNVDLTYGNDGITLPVTMKYFSAAIQDDGKIVVVGTLAFPTFVHDQTKIVRFNLNGSVDFTYTSTEIGTYYTFPSKLIKQDNNLVLLGYNTSFASGTNNDFIYIFKDTGLTGFFLNPARRNANSVGYNLANYSLSKTVAIRDNKLIIAGLEQMPATTFPYIVNTRYYVSKYVNGNLDPTFGNNGQMPETLPAASYEHMSIAPDGKLLLANSIVNTSTNNSDFSIVRLNEDGSSDLTFNGNGAKTTDFGSNDTAYAIAFQKNKIIVAGSTQNKITGDKEFAIARYNDNGSLDSTFSDDGKQTLGEAGNSYKLEQLKIDSNRLYASGNITSNSNEEWKITAAYLLNYNLLLVCPDSKKVSNDKGICASLVNNISPVITPVESNAAFSYTLSGATTGSGTGSASGTTFNKGETVVTYKLINEPAKTCSFKVTVEDKEAPVIANVSANPNSIWPPNHTMKDVEIGYNMSDNCGEVNSTISVTSNEPESGTDSEDIAGDWKIIDAHHLQLRAERAGKGSGRIYTITIAATDASGNKSEQHTEVVIPHDNSGIKGTTDFSVKVLSNPVKDFFTLIIQSNKNEPVSLRVCDLFGRIIETRSDLTRNGTFQLGSTYRRGIYVAELKQGSKKETFTLMKY